MSVIVADTGAGIPPSEMDDLLNRGVGLSNVNSRLVKLYGQSSRLRVDSAAGQGTTVSFSVPTNTEISIETQFSAEAPKSAGASQRGTEGLSSSSLNSA
jgi:signal transduction histidine kinase